MFQAICFRLRVLVCALTVVVLAGPVGAQERPDSANRPENARETEAAKKPDFARYQGRPDGSMPLIHDWSSRHVIYTAGYTEEQAERMAKDPRAYASFLAHGIERRRHEPVEHRPVAERGALDRDWNVSLGAGTLQQWEGSFPAKYSFDVNAPPSCTNDFAVFPVPAATGGARAVVVGTFTRDPSVSQTASITITPAGLSAVTLVLTAGTTNSGTTFAVSGTNSTTKDATNLAAAINRNLSSVALDEVAATASGSVVAVVALTAGSRVALTVSDTLSNFNWGAVTAGKSGSQANVVGLNNLYAGSGSPLCAGFTCPTFTFSYSAGVGTVLTSPSVSLDGQKIVFVENDTVQGLGAILHVLTLGTGTEHGSCTNSGTAAPTCATAAVIPGSTLGSRATDYMLPLGELAGGTQPTDDYVSSPFVDYFGDVLYVGDSGGNLFSVSPVFGSGTPAVRSGFPVAVDPLNALASPVVDLGNTGNIFVEDVRSLLYNVTPGGVVEGSIALGYNDVQPEDAPDVDSTNGVGYAVSGCGGTAGSSNPAVLVQFSTTATGNPGVLATANLNYSWCSGGPAMYGPTEDNNYFTKGIASSTPGNNGELLVEYPSQPNGSLAQFQFTSGILNTTAEYTDNNSSFGIASFSPLTEFYGDDQAYTIGTVTQSGNTVTVTTAANAFVSDQVVVVSGVQAGSGGCTSAAANAIGGEQTVTVTSPTSFTFTSAVSATIGGVNGSCTLTSALATGPTQDYLFFASTHPEVFTFDLPLTSATQAPAATNTTSVGASSGAGGMIIDNDSSSGQASSIYFGTGGPTSNCGPSAYCAVKLTQAGLN